MKMFAVNCSSSLYITISLQDCSNTVRIEFNVITGDKKVKVTEPSAPQNLTVSDVRSDSITINWSAPTEDGGKPVQKYIICMKEVGTKKLRKVSQADIFCNDNLL